MSNTIKLKRGSGSDPSASDLVVGELAIRTDSGKIFTKKDNGSVAEISGGGGISDGDKGDITVSNGGDTFTIDNGVITNVKIQPSAGIAGTKIDPDFGNQTVLAGLVNAPVLKAQGASGSGDGIILVDSGGGQNNDFSRIRQAIADDSFIIENKSSGSYESFFKGNSDRGAELHFQGSKKLETLTGGVSITGSLTTSGTFASGNQTITSTAPSITFTDSDSTPNYQILVNLGAFAIKDNSAGANRLTVDSSKIVSKLNHDFDAGIDVTGNITVSGTVDGVDVDALNTTVGNITTGTVNNDGKFLRANNGSAPTYETISQFVASNVIGLHDQTSNKVQRLLASAEGVTVQGTSAGVSKLMFRDRTTANFLKFKPVDTLSAGVEFTLPSADGSANTVLKTDGSGVMSFGTIVNASVDASAAIAGSKIDPDFGSQNVTTTGNLNGKNLNLVHTSPTISLTDSNADDDFDIKVDGGSFKIIDATNSNDRFAIDSSGNITATGTFNTGSINVTGSVIPTGNVNLGDSSNSNNNRFIAGASDDLMIYHDGSNSYIEDAGTGELRLRGTTIRLSDHDGSETFAVFNDNGSVQLYHDNSLKFQTNSNGCRFVGALAGIDNEKVLLGTGNDLEIYHTGTRAEIINGTGDFVIQASANNNLLLRAQTGENHLKGVHNGQVELYYDGSKKFETISGGAKVTGELYSDGLRVGDSENIRIGDDEDFQIYHDGTDGYIDNNTGNLNILCDSNQAINLKHGSENMLRAITDGAVELYHDGVRKLHTRSDAINIIGDLDMTDADNYKINLGASSDLQIYHDGSNSYITNAVGDLVFQHGTENLMQLKDDGAVQLYYDNALKFETQSGGVKVTGNLDCDGIRMVDGDDIRLGNSDDLQLVHSSGVNQILTNGPNLKIGTTGETFALFRNNNAVELYYDNSNKLQTTSSGVNVSGDITLTATQPAISFIDDGQNPDYKLYNNNGTLRLYDITNTSDRLVVNSDGHIDVTGNLDVGAGLDVTGNISVTGTVDGRDIASDGAKLDGIQAGATADQTGSEIRALLAATSNTNILNDTLLAKLNGIASGATNVTNNNQLTNGAGYITASQVSSAPAAAKKWVVFSQSTIADDVGISSITYHGTGQYTINFDGNMANTNYSVQGFAFRNGAGRILVHVDTYSTYTTSALRIMVSGGNNVGNVGLVTVNPNKVNIAIWGDT